MYKEIKIYKKCNGEGSHQVDFGAGRDHEYERQFCSFCEGTGRLIYFGITTNFGYHNQEFLNKLDEAQDIYSQDYDR
jgi:hypothetical protein